MAPKSPADKPRKPPAAPKPKKRVKRGLTASQKKTGIRRIQPCDMDPAFQSDEDMHKREMFAQAYVAYGSLRKAAETAGFGGKPHTLTIQGARLMAEPWVRDRVQRIKDDLLHELKITQRGVLAELARIGFADIRQIIDPATGCLLPLEKIPVDTALALSSYKETTKTFGEMVLVEKEVKFENKSAALEKLGKHAGLWVKDDDGRGGVNAEDFARALGEGIARVIAGKRTLQHSQ
ncbi:MAG: terminase small subunit [Pseudomonadota bacterium]